MEKHIIIETERGKVILPIPQKNITEHIPDFINKVGHKYMTVKLVEVKTVFKYNKN